MKTQNTNDQGVVYRKNLGQYLVLTNGHEIPCAVSSLVRKQLVYPTADPRGRRTRVQSVRELKHADPIAVGDDVLYVDAGDGTGMIVEVLPRRSQLTRPASGSGGSADQVVAANVDQVVAVFAAARPAPKWRLLDRYLVSAEAAGLPIAICITKLDLAQPGDGLEEALNIYRRIGYPLILASSATGEGLDDVRAALDGRVSVLIGKSGVGKTSLLNALQPGLGLRVRAVSKIEKGRHTTTHAEMFPLDKGGAIVDTPGMREFGLSGVDPDDLALFFPEMRPFIGQCRFRLDCRHNEEPGCAIRSAVMDGEISPQRYGSYLGLAETLP